MYGRSRRGNVSGAKCSGTKMPLAVDWVINRGLESFEDNELAEEYQCPSQDIIEQAYFQRDIFCKLLWFDAL